MARMATPSSRLSVTASVSTAVYVPPKVDGDPELPAPLEVDSEHPVVIITTTQSAAVGAKATQHFVFITFSRTGDRWIGDSTLVASE
jgi:hypothetical protein